MKLKDARAEYNAYSGKASDVARQLAFAAIAVVWIFKTDQAGTPKVPRELIWPASFAIGCLAADVLQYLYGSAAWGYFHRWKEKQKIGEEAEFLAPREINWPTIILFWLKLSLIVVTYVLLLIYLARALF
jgi:hypothetical protein